MAISYSDQTRINNLYSWKCRHIFIVKVQNFKYYNTEDPHYSGTSFAKALNVLVLFQQDLIAYVKTIKSVFNISKILRYKILKLL